MLVYTLREEWSPMRRTRIKMMAAVMAATMLLGGCGDALYDLTDDEENVIVNYAAHIVTKYNTYQREGLTYVSPEEPEETQEDVTVPQTPETPVSYTHLINNFGYSIHIGQDEVHPKELQKLLLRIDGTPEEALISRLTLRSMKQAKYSTVNTGHFGLATSYYCHFTSPIRRYPDLQIHRIIKDNLRGRMNAKRIEHYEKILPEVAKHSSEMERRADEAERECDKLKKVQYMSGHLGEEFWGVISGVTEWGFYVELPNTVEGLVHVTTLTDDYFHYSESTYELIGETTAKRYKLRCV